MNRAESLIVVGFLLVFIGAIIVVLGSPNTGGSFVFVFPFFFIGEASPIVVVIMLAMTVLFLVFMLQPLIQRTRNRGRQDTFLRATRSCKLCGNLIPDGSRYCLTCGSPVEE